ncbi:MAG: hypothetical protein D6725_18335 [Planctomycetota bacterium]|nr:MAG: hypothetical protein D6725_18335 [Planctomycetota bacterium]
MLSSGIGGCRENHRWLELPRTVVMERRAGAIERRRERHGCYRRCRSCMGPSSGVRIMRIVPAEWPMKVS